MISPIKRPAAEPKVPGAIGSKPIPKKVIICLFMSILVIIL